jgi:predicted GNAT superfamily acetyltransferase
MLPMNIQIRNVTVNDFAEVLKLNEAAAPNVNSVDLAKLAWFSQAAAYFRVAESGGKVAGFLIAIAAGADYPSQYFDWFCQRYTNFIYIDRIVIAEWARRQGVGFALYRDVEQYAFESAYTVVSDVYSDPPNEVSLAFHAKYGFVDVGRQTVENGARVVTKFLKQPQNNQAAG